MQVEDPEKLQKRISQLEKRLKSAESQCQATTKEIWQMEVELSRMGERLQEAEQALAAHSNEAPAPDSAGVVPTQAELQDALDREAELVRSLASEREESQALREQLDEARGRERALLEQQHSQGTQTDASHEASLRSRLDDSEYRVLELEDALEQRAVEMAETTLRLDEFVEQSRRQAGELEERLSQAQQQSESFVSRVEELSQRLQTALDQLEELRAERDRLADQCEALRVELAHRAEQVEVEAPFVDGEQLAALQQRVEQLQSRLELSEEKAGLVQQRYEDADARAQIAQRESQSQQQQLERLEARVREADRVYEAADELRREAEQKTQESWQRVRDAEMRANQAIVENKRLTDRLAEHEKRAQEADRETQRLAFQDTLTGLPNANLISQYLEFTVKNCVRYRRVAALIVVDIDRFKVFNEAMGTKAGDELLVKVAERLQQSIRDTDSLGRRGEDEFILLLSELNVGEYPTAEARLRAIHQHVQVVANRVQQMIAAPFTVQGQKFTIEVSMGIAICPDDGETPQSLLENADTAMYHVKETGRNRHQFYTHDLRRRQEKRLSLDMQLRSALERGEFEVRYHPIVSLAKGKGSLVGVEALLRWNHRIDGVVGPEYFLPAAEESGMIVPIGHWVMAQTCAQMREWLNFGLRIFASVNLSKRQLLQSDLVDGVTRELTRYGIPPEALYIEIAEGFNTFNPELMDQVINRLGAAGIRVAIDDFGVGYSSLSRLNLNYTRVLKIDRSIVEGCPHDRQSATVCIAAINLASSLGLVSLAEGVENINQVKFLTKYGCALAQGHYFAEPAPPAEITNYHRTKKVWKI